MRIRQKARDMIDLENPEHRARLLRWAWLLSIAVLVLGYVIMFLLITGRLELR
ncbi:MAG: hypothetical protein J7J06_02190 [Methanosarcinales archaeon]|nr:hypothetical protein [Methanosarcinales archaeon]